MDINFACVEVYPSDKFQEVELLAKGNLFFFLIKKFLSFNMSYGLQDLSSRPGIKLTPLVVALDHQGMSRNLYFKIEYYQIALLGVLHQFIYEGETYEGACFPTPNNIKCYH